tara:strand:- start:107 stop:670 length:564 start_codon:yes stop_codon:yes gene_type:complete
MRIISGNFKGKKLLMPKDLKTRPLKDLTKESIFNLISHSNKFKINIKNSIVLDLFSGIGSFGIECLSREAKHVTFVENYKAVLPILRKNLNSLKITKKYEIIEKNIFSKIDLTKIKNKFDIIFLDPPYKEENINKIIECINSNLLLKKNGVIIIHRHKNNSEKLFEDLRILEERKYGISKIFFGTLN